MFARATLQLPLFGPLSPSDLASAAFYIFNAPRRLLVLDPVRTAKCLRDCLLLARLERSLEDSERRFRV